MSFKRKIPPLILTIFLTLLNFSLQEDKISILGIEPNGGLTNGETRVLVRLKNFNSDLIATYPHPSCRFGSSQYTVSGTYTKCTPKPRKPGERQPSTAEKTEICIQCENSPKHSDDIVPFTVSLLGDYTDTMNSIPYRYYDEPKIIYITPRSGPKDGNTLVDVYGEGFLNFDQNLRCGFGSKEVKGIFINTNHIQCVSPFSSIVQRKLPFSISLNNQQNTQDDIPYVYYENPTIYRIEPTNRGPDSGGTVILLRGANFNPFKELGELKLENDTFCSFESLGKRPAKIHSSTEIECVTPPSYEKLEVPVEITLNNQQYTEDNVPFYYYHQPYTYYISPKIGPVSGGTIVKVMGGNFEDTGVVKCKFGDKLGKGKFISKNELQCESPAVEKPCVVPLRVATRDEEYSSGINTQFTYYDTPIIHFIEPACGPSTGYTQITVFGENFPVGYSNNVKCLFNGEIKTDATIMNYNELKCDSPALPTKPGSEEAAIQTYNLTILVNEDVEAGPVQHFYYYKSPVISGISPIMGGVDGDTTVKISGSGFAQPGACNITTRFATYHAKPVLVEDNFMIVKSPEANYTGSVVVQVSLNGQQFGDDITYNFRDQQNTFYYYKCPIVSGIHPDEGPSVGGNDISIYGIGFLEPFFALDKENNLKAALYDGKITREIFYRFVDLEDDAIIYGETQSISLEEDATTQKIVLKSPSIIKSSNYRGRNNIKTLLQLSYDGENFCDYENILYTFFNLPNIIDISPKYTPLEAKDQQIEIKLDNLDCNGKDDCSKGIKCRFTATKEDSNKVFVMEGQFIEKNKIICNAPNVNIPEEFNIEASINGGEDYTNNNFNYTYYDPFVLKVEPQMLSDKGNTEIKITGYGFANTGKNMKALFGDSETQTLKCGEKGEKCIVHAEYKDSTELTTISKPRKDVVDKETNEPIDHYKHFPLEVAIYNDDFTNNKVTVFYYQDPKIINDIDSASGEALHLTDSSKAELRDSLVDSIPCNLDTFIPIPVDGLEIERHLDEINSLAKYTCLFEANGKKKVTDGVFTKFPLNNTVHNLFLCQSPRFVNEVTDNAQIRISLNGYDFSDDYYKIALTDPVNIYKIVPACGPIEGGTNVKIYGTGFQNTEKAVFKWGPQNLVPMNKKTFLEKTNEQTSQEVLYDMQKIIALNNPDEDLKRDELLESLEDVEIQKIIVTAPHAPDDNEVLKTRGGLDYISVSKTNLLPLDDFLREYYANNFIHTNFEYYYYRQLYIEGFYPSGSISTGGAKVMVIGAWFQYKPEYGVRPYCKFGDEVVEGEYLSNVRIVCEAPPSAKEFIKVPFSVSLNGEDWVEAEKPFRYYGDFKNAEFDLIEPDSGPSTGGTNVKIYGKGFTAIFDENELLCQFEPVDTILEEDEDGNMVEKEVKSLMEPINVPARLSSPLRERNQHSKNEEDNYEIDEEGTYIECQTPGGWPKGSKTNVKIAFDGQTFLDTKQNFYFFQIDKIFPRAGPNTGEGNMEFIGGGFEHDGNITLVMNKANYKPINATEKELEFEIPDMPKDFTGYVDMDVYLNGVDEIEFKDGFYYYIQPTLDSIYPKAGPSTGKTIFHVFGTNFRDDFKGANITCKVGSCIGTGEVISDKEMKCNFDNLPVEHVEFTEKKDGTKVKSGNPIQIALNGVTYTAKNPKLTINTYSIQEITPVSGPIETGTIIVVKGAGFTKSENIRCRFGVPGYYAYTEGTFIDYNKITCPSPKGFEIPNGGGLPFTVPFSIAFNDDEFNPWTQTSHVFTFYKTPDVAVLTPKEFNTTSIVPVYFKADSEEQQFFSMPLASIKEDEYQVLNKDGEHIRQVKKTVKDQPITCRFGKYGVTEADFLNETDITCLTPKFQDDDDDIVYEEVQIEVAPNGVDYIDAGKANIKGQEAKNVGCMYCILAILGVLFLAALAGLIAWMCSKKMLGIDGEIPKEPHTQNRKLRYLNEGDGKDLIKNEQSP